MIYIQYHDCKNKYYDAQKDFEKVLSEKERLFAKTQPAAVDTTKDTVSGGTPTNEFDNYLIEMEKKNVDKRLDEARSILDDRLKIFKLKEDELYHSKDRFDVIYKYYFIEKLSIRKTAMKMDIGQTEIFRKVQKIRKNINLEQKGTKVGV